MMPSLCIFRNPWLIIYLLWQYGLGIHKGFQQWVMMLSNLPQDTDTTLSLKPGICLVYSQFLEKQQLSNMVISVYWLAYKNGYNLLCNYVHARQIPINYLLYYYTNKFLTTSSAMEQRYNQSPFCLCNAREHGHACTQCDSPPANCFVLCC